VARSADPLVAAQPYFPALPGTPTDFIGPTADVWARCVSLAPWRTPAPVPDLVISHVDHELTTGTPQPDQVVLTNRGTTDLDLAGHVLASGGVSLTWMSQVLAAGESLTLQIAATGCPTCWDAPHLGDGAVLTLSDAGGLTQILPLGAVSAADQAPAFAANLWPGIWGNYGGELYDLSCTVPMPAEGAGVSLATGAAGTLPSDWR
jgi:hypothetical protein